MCGMACIDTPFCGLDSGGRKVGSEHGELHPRECGQPPLYTLVPQQRQAVRLLARRAAEAPAADPVPAALHWAAVAGASSRLVALRELPKDLIQYKVEDSWVSKEFGKGVVVVFDH